MSSGREEALTEKADCTNGVQRNGTVQSLKDDILEDKIMHWGRGRLFKI